jgi:4-amino-4-deoxy-L-arabinose transferase-like glycosyltransferase
MAREAEIEVGQATRPAADRAPGVTSARPGPRRLVRTRRLAARAWELATSVPSGRLAVATGVLVTLPFSLLARYEIEGTDSARLLASIGYVRRHGTDWLVQTQEVLVPHLLLGPLLQVDANYRAVRIFLVLWLLALGGLVAYLASRLPVSLLAAAASALALVSFARIVIQARHVTMYVPMVTLGYAGSWLAYRAMASAGRRRWLLAVAAALCLVLASETQPVGQLFFAAPLLLLVLRSSRGALAAAGAGDGAAALFLVPRIVINVSEGGLRHFRSARTDYWIEKGYLDLVNSNFRSFAVERSEFPQELARMFGEAVGYTGIPAAILAVVGLVALSWRGRVFALGCTLFLAGAVFATTPAPFPRYLVPLLPGMAILAGAAVHYLLGLPARLRPRLRRRLAAAVAAGTVSALLLGTLASFALVARGHPNFGLLRKLTTLSGAIDDGKAVVGVRASLLSLVDRDVDAYGAQFLNEREYVTFLSWPSDQAVISVFRARDIGWILVLPERRRRLEIEYNNAWLEPTYGLSVNYHSQLKASPYFCLAVNSNDWKLYRLLDRPRGPDEPLCRHAGSG